MALLNNNYVLVTEENEDNSVDITSHPTEQGLPLSDTVRRQPILLNLTGKIVDTDNADAETIINRLKTLQKEGSLITYVGQLGTRNNLQIQSFNTNRNNKNNGGADFDMSLKEARIAQRAYARKSSHAVVENNSKPEVGDMVLFTGGYVYISSDAKLSFTKKGQSQCKLTKISTLPNRKHIYHLISQDCKWGSSHYVFGWVDASNVKVLVKNISKYSSSGGTQQVN